MLKSHNFLIYLIFTTKMNNSTEVIILQQNIWNLLFIFHFDSENCDFCEIVHLTDKYLLITKR